MPHNRWLQTFNPLLIIVMILTGVFVDFHSTQGAHSQQPARTVGDKGQERERETSIAHPPRTVEPLRASEQRVQFNHITVEDGLSHPVVYDILQDRQGFLWFATEDGLNRYDGYTFKVYKPDHDTPNSLHVATVLSLLEDHHGNLWVGTRGGGLSKFDPVTETFTTYRHDPANPNSISSNVVTYEGLYEDAQGMIWIGTPFDGMNRFDPETETFTHYDHDPDDPQTISPGVVTSLVPASLEHGHEGLWVGTTGGLNRFDPETETFTHYRHDPDDPYTLSSNLIHTLAWSPEGDVLWVGTQDGLNRLEIETERVTRYLHDPENPASLIWQEITSLELQEDGTLWISTPVGLDYFDPVSETFTHYRHSPTDPTSLSNDTVQPILCDNTGILWVGTWGGGVNSYAPSRYKFTLYQNRPSDPTSLSHNSILGLYTDRDGIVWVGTWGGGLNRFDPETEIFTHYTHDPDDPQSLSNNSVHTIYEDSQGILWVGTYGGLNAFDRSREQFTRYLNDPGDPNSLRHNSIRAIAEDEEGTLWIGTTYGGLHAFDRTTGHFTNYSPEPGNPDSITSANIWDVLIDSQGTIWVTSGYGIERLDPETEVFTHYLHDPHDPHSFRGNVAIQIYEDHNHTIWVASDTGLNRFDRQTGQFTHYTTRDGLPSNRVETIQEDEHGILWLGTTRGLSRFDPETETFRNYTVFDGLQGNMFLHPAATRHPDGTLFFGGTNGLNAFDPDSMIANTEPPPVVLTDFQLFNESVPIREDSVLQQSPRSLDHLTLTHDQNRFTFAFAALSYAAPEKNRYRYRLEGFETRWNKTNSSRRFATYSSLPAGIYWLHVQGSNNDGVWNTEGVRLKITILPPWWETWWFQGIMLLLIGGVAFTLYQWRVYSVQQRNRQLTSLVAEQTTALRESERTLSNLINNLPGLVYRCHYNAVWKTSFISKGCLELTGYAPSAFREDSPVTLATLVHPDDRQHVAAAVEESLQNQQPFALSYRIVDRQGREKWVWSQGSGVFGQDGEVLFIEGLLMDISERKRYEDDIRTLHQAVRQSPASVIITDPRGTIQYVNPRFTQITGFTFEEAYEQNPRMLKSGLVSQVVYRELWDTITSGGEWRGELLNRRKDGTLYWEMAYISPILNDEGVITHFVGVKEDITERKQMEEDLQRAKEAAESATRSKSAFLATMSHEIRTPMNAVIGMTSLLLMTSLTEEQEEYVQTIRISGDALLSLINDILDFSKIEAGYLQLERQTFYLRTAVEEALELLAPRAAEKGLELAYWVEDDVPETILGDITRVRQVLVNLLSNAVKFTETGEVVVTIEGQGSENEGPGQVQFGVRDTGIGIPSDRLDRLFKPFSQVDASTTRRYGGTGLGLVISKRLAELMGGTMWVESKPGLGSTFFFTIAVPAEREVSLLPEPELTIPTAALSDKRALIVAENTTSRDILGRYLTRWGMHARSVASLAEAEQLFHDGSEITAFHVAILDLDLSHNQNLAPLQALTQQRDDQPVALAGLVLTPIGVRSETSISSNSSPVAFLTKPIRPLPLARLLANLLEGHSAEKKRINDQAAEQLQGQQHPLRILLAEDNIVNQKVAVRFLERLGYLPDVAANGLEVLDAVRQRSYDVVLMDVQMPEMDGIETTHQIRSSFPAHQQPYIIAMTAHAMEGDREWCLKSGMDDYTRKPVVLDELAQKLRGAKRRTQDTSLK